MPTYDPKKTLLTVLGNVITGYAPGSFVKVERNSDGWDLKMGADGSGVRVRKNDRSGKITINLLPSSPSNDVLSVLAITDEASGTSVGPSSLADLNGTSKYFAARSWVKKFSDGDYTDDAANREWVIETDRLDMFVGSNF